MANLSFLFPLIAIAMGRRGRRHRRAARFFGNPHPGSFWNASTMLGALGLGVGAYEVFRSRKPTSSSSAAANTTTVVGEPARPHGGPPPLPAYAADAHERSIAELSDAGRRLVQLMLAAARADGDLGEEEYGQLMREARKIGADALVESERGNPRTLTEIVAGISDPAHKRELYVFAYGIVRADEKVSGTERIWLARLATLLGLDKTAVERLEKDTDTRIDSESEIEG